MQKDELLNLSENITIKTLTFYLYNYNTVVAVHIIS